MADEKSKPTLADLARAQGARHQAATSEADRLRKEAENRGTSIIQKYAEIKRDYPQIVKSINDELEGTGVSLYIREDNITKDNIASALVVSVNRSWQSGGIQHRDVVLYKGGRVLGKDYIVRTNDPPTEDLEFDEIDTDWLERSLRAFLEKALKV